jgi:hypothetical protein
LRAVIVVMALCACAAPSALAQTSSDAGRRDRSLFGNVDPKPGGAGSLTATMALSNTYDDDISDGQLSAQSPMVSGKYSNLNAALSYSSKRRRVTASADAATSLRHYSDRGSLVGSHHSAGTAVDASLNPKTTVRARLDGSYVSGFAFEAFEAIDRRPDAEAESRFLSERRQTPFDWTMTSYGGAAELTRTFGRRSSVALSYATRYGERHLLEEYNNERAVALRFGQSTGRNTSVGVSYSMRQGTQRVPDYASNFRSHDVQLGVERSWQRSALRRTVVSLSAGPALARDEPYALPREGTLRLLSAVGAITIRHDVNSNWTMGLSYRRGAGFSSRRVSSNAASIDVNGSAGRRTVFTLSAGYSDGDIGLYTLDNRYATSFATARLQVALTRLVAIYGQGFAYHYDFGNLASLPSTFPPQLRRRALRAGVTLWLPLLGR